MPAPVIIGFDGSEHAHDALVLGQRLADVVGAPLLVASLYHRDPMYDALTYGDVERELHAAAEAQLREAEKALDGRPIAEYVAMAATSTPRGLHALAAERGAQLVVVGSTHRGAVGRVTPGSVAQRLLNGAPCPVAVAPAGLAAGDVKMATIAVAFDGSEESRHALRAAIALARYAGARIDLVGVVEPLRPTLGASYAMTTGNRVFEDDLRVALDRKLAEAMERVPAEHRGSRDIFVGDAAKMLAARSEDADLLVCGSRGYGLVRQVLLGGVSGKLVHHAQCPLLVVPRGEAAELIGAPAATSAATGA